MSQTRPHAVESLSKDRLRLWLRLLKVTGHVEGELRRRLRADHATTLPRFDVMAALARHPKGLRMSDLSDFLRVSNGNVTGIVDRLTEEGLALRVAVEGDRRAQLARLTPAGEAVFAELAAAHEAWVNDLLGTLDAPMIEQAFDLLTRIEPRETERP
ncbi:MarR family transcriptional regulator [Roseibaca sp. V10]|uniref:MarR family transcriptional regulator n=1 Tax=Roseinatronobacter domitianus TaxID=2940293 RepID=A0ABT0LXZ1_9RHOB|nr:MarR family transcriptional regulator [Roseibaca domitiana]MCL1627480.1 MarR family transcriptional regulator [Roseibaca domitiana]